MSTNRTKIDWAYKQACKIAMKVRTASDSRVAIREIAAILRRIEKRGRPRLRAGNQSRSWRGPDLSPEHRSKSDDHR